MSIKRRISSRRLKRVLLWPFYVVANTFVALRDALDQILIFIGLKGRGRRRRNKDFERAGREVPNIESYDSRAAANLDRADQVRDKEILRQVIYENRMLRKNTKEAKELREEMISDNLSVSQGQSINHLAEMNRRAAEKEKLKQPTKERPVKE
ncbi:MAG: hypothetical protein AAGA30_09460 [Planctomycetota bacterium]